MAVPPLLLNQIHAAHDASTAALEALNDLLTTIEQDDAPLINFQADIFNVRTTVTTAVERVQDSINTIDNLLDEGVDLPDYITTPNIHIYELPNIMDAVMQKYHDGNKLDMIGHLNIAHDLIESIDDSLAEMIQNEDQPQNNSNNNGSSNVSYNSNESNGGRRKKSTLRKRRNHSKKRMNRKQTQRKRTHRKRTHRKRTHRK